MKKRLISVILVLVMLFVALPVFAAISTPVVRVNLIRNAVITQEQLDEAVSTYSEQYGYQIDSATVLDALISDELFKQGLEREGYALTDDQQNELLSSQKSSIESSVGVTFSDEEFDQFLQYYYGFTAEEYKQYLTNQYLLQAYVLNAKSDMFNAIAEPTDEEIEAFYKKNKTSLISTENVKLSHIFFNVQDKDKDAVLASARKVYEEIKSGAVTFEKAVTLYSDDNDSKDSAGEIGWLSIDDDDNIEYMGQNFFDEVFKLEAGDISNVIESNAGYHIVKILVHNDARILGLDDKISPVATETVREYIAEYLYEQEIDDVFTDAYAALIEDLKAEASIKYLN